MHRKSTTRIDRICPICGNQYSVYPSTIKKVPRHTCSMKCQAINRTVPPDQRFWNHVLKTDGCWIWTGARDPRGYGQLNIKHHSARAHRLSYEMAYGPISEGLCVLHNCPTGDNRACVNPAHLWLGTLSDNTRDMVAKKRYGAITKPDRIPRGATNGATKHPERYRGEKNGRARLTITDVRAIREMSAHGMSDTVIAGQFGVCPATIYYVVRRKTWRDVI